MKSQLNDKIKERKSNVFLYEYEENPLEYYSNKVEEVDFLGYTIAIHKQFKPYLEEINKKLTNKYSKSKNSFSNGGIGGFAIRFLNVKPVLSPHSFGTAIDVDYKINPEFNASDKIIADFIYGLTMQKVWGNKATIESMYLANKYFTERLKNKPMATYFNVLSDIEAYEKNKDNLSLFQLFDYKNTFNLVNSLEQSYTIIKTDIETYKALTRDNLYNSQYLALRSEFNKHFNIIDLITTQLESLTANLQKYNYVFCLEEINLSDYEKLKSHLKELRILAVSMKTELTSIKKYIEEDKQVFEWNPKGIAFESYSFRTSEAELIKYISAHYKLMHEEYTKINFSASLEYIITSKEKSYWPNGFFKDGFFNLGLDFVVAFTRYKNELRWGGNYTSKKDWMHFEIEPRIINF